MKTLFAFAIASGLLFSNSPAMADEISAWAALEAAVQDADSATTALSWTDANDLDALGDTLDLSIQYMEGLVNGGKQRDASIEDLLTSAFVTMDYALQSDESAAGSFETAFGFLQTAGAALELANFPTAETDANAGKSELINTQSILNSYGMDLMLLDFENTELSTAIQFWLSGGMGGMGCP